MYVELDTSSASGDRLEELSRRLTDHPAVVAAKPLVSSLGKRFSIAAEVTVQATDADVALRLSRFILEEVCMRIDLLIGKVVGGRVAGHVPDGFAQGCPPGSSQTHGLMSYAALMANPQYPDTPGTCGSGSSANSGCQSLGSTRPGCTSWKSPKGF